MTIVDHDIAANRRLAAHARKLSQQMAQSGDTEASQSLTGMADRAELRARVLCGWLS